MKLQQLALVLALACTAASAQVVSDVTEDGLVRVPSTRRAGVYRSPDVLFTRYQRVMIAPASITFQKNWDRKNPGVKPAERERIVNDLASLFHAELVAELVERGGYELVDAPAPDVLLVVPTVTDLDINAPEGGTVPGTRTFVHSAGSMTLTVELRDAPSGVPVGRIIDYEQARETRELQIANQVTNNWEARVGFANAARYTREALNVAKTERKETISEPR